MEIGEAIGAFAKSYKPPSAARDAVCIPALTGSADAFLALALTKGNRIVLAVTPGLPDADRLTDDLRLVSAKDRTRILELPPYLGDDKSALGTRLKTLSALKAWALAPYPAIVVAASQALATPIPKNATPSLFIRSQGAITLTDLTAKCAALGYRRVSQVEREGDFSVRGGILDVWSPGDAFPVRSEFFGDDLESLRTFNPATQTSIAPVDEAEIVPIETPAESGDNVPSTDTLTLLDILPDNAALLALDHNAYTLPPRRERALQTVYTGDPAPAHVPTYAFQTAPLPGFAELGADEAHHPELFDQARHRLEQHLAAAEKRGKIILTLDDLSGGFEIGDLVVVAKSDRVFAKHHHHVRANAAIAQGPRLNDFEDLEPGEYVVHVDYGVGRYIGSSVITLDGRESEVFTIEYADGGKLHIPASHAHLLSRYVGVKGESVHLHRLDGKRWEKDKADAQKAVSDLAASLLETQAKRDTVPGFAYDVACEGRDAFDAAFPYEETSDQLAAIAAIEKDLATRKPMDRLICGDAGYGKTEVAMRAAYIAVMNGKQVAVLAPTTVLAEQHFETFTSRFDGTPVRIESVSRFQTTGTHDGTFKRLLSGVCDIVIGTHAILTKKIAFHDLGLIIIDEEQRFGVRHKEFLKRLRATADVLTLSATPIPRTLYLSMTGVRDLSLLRSPPRERVAVETHIERDSDDVIRAAIERERTRGGQVFFLHNRVLSIGRVEKRLREIVPDARIVVAHGQMDTRTLAVKMRAFERGQYDILLSTTIIESGIDIPRANTILVDQAEMFGMADLYQLRGRVGRSARQGYAYFLLPPSGDVDAEARERLQALKRHGGLGSGFNLAVRDLELRGAGNLLGSQQSGHIAAIGFSLYCQLLTRTIAAMRGERVKRVVDVNLNLDFVHPRIPFTYIEDEIQRLTVMKRFAEAQDVKEVRALADELRDRFGPLPEDVRTYVKVGELRTIAAAAGITHIDTRDGRAFIYRTGSRDVDRVVDLKAKADMARLDELIAISKSRSRG